MHFCLGAAVMAPRKTKRKYDDKHDGSKEGKCKKKSNNSQNCIIHFADVRDNDLTNMNEERYNRIVNIVNELKKDKVGKIPGLTTPIPSTISENHGYHRRCYQKLTCNLKRLRTKANLLSESKHVSRQTRKSGNQKDGVKFVPNCIFCGNFNKKVIKKDNSWTTEQLKFVQPDSWQVIVNQAEKKADEILLRRIRGYDLVACGAQYHNSCRKEYMVNPDNWRSMNEESTEDQKWEVVTENNLS